jgi:hypothetical protein
MTNPVKINNPDPYQTLNSPTRPVSGPVKFGAVTLDQFYGPAIYATWLMVDVDGTISVTQWDGTVETLPGLLPHVWHPCHSIQINSSGTTATGLVWGI